MATQIKGWRHILANTNLDSDMEDTEHQVDSIKINRKLTKINTNCSSKT